MSEKIIAELTQAGREREATATPVSQEEQETLAALRAGTARVYTVPTSRSPQDTRAIGISAVTQVLDSDPA